ncbi:WhiB family transcriptional regulator [Sanguibacter antarcticus]|uniref:Transcriptional regulator WhiB n=1 Tax=Sanguibacter antarcticus TaxID=372484 RepID=A0A2A9E4T1_9MICO|nr:WhiB family transcriptional regulator [Sanguibacter antarcticus]PFG33853.1 WhiB family redox-sensing transcriptional regulator [Sanguibacter antarcticus]
MRQTTLLDTISRQGSAGQTAQTPPAARPAAQLALSTREGREFDDLVARMAPCRSNDPELWFAEQPARIDEAKALCRECPLMVGCLTGAIDRAEPWGVWGGEVFVDGVVVARKRGRGRPRKDAVA